MNRSREKDFPGARMKPSAGERPSSVSSSLLPPSSFLFLVISTVCGCALTAPEVCETIGRNVILPEQRTIQVRDPAQLPPARLPDIPAPRTVSEPQPETPEWRLSLDEAIRIALENTRVVRVLAGTTATNSGQTIYDAAVTNTTIDEAQARFDPVFSHSSTWDRLDSPTAVFNPLDPTRSLLSGSESKDYSSKTGLTKTNVFGGQWALNWNENASRFPSDARLPLNPQTHRAVELSYTQPLLQGAGYRFNMAPVVIARINTEQSFFQYKDSVQEMVRGVIEAYWNLVQTRTAVEVAKYQEEFFEKTLRVADAKLRTGLGDIVSVAQARVSYNQFRASRIAAEANLLTREGALRNLLGLPPSDDRRIVPVSVATKERLKPDWDALVRLAEQRRPDVVELKLVTEADQVRLLQARNQALPQLNAVALYRWNGLSGEMPNGERLSSSPGEFPDWSLGVTFSVPLGLRQGRAHIRQQELLIARDRANVEQSLHAAVHDLASTVRDVENAYEEYLAFKETRAAAVVNVRVQYEKFGVGNQNILNVLQAINDWGNATTSETQQLLNYNISLAALERQTGTILEGHGLVFYEERLHAAGPLGIPGCDSLYPTAVVPDGEPQRYPDSGEPSENAFDLKSPVPLRGQKAPEKIPPPLPGAGAK